MALVQVSSVLKTISSGEHVQKLTGVKQGNLLVLLLSFGQATNGNAPTVADWTVAQNPAGDQITLGGGWAGSAIFYRTWQDGSVPYAIVLPGAGATVFGATSVMAEFDRIETTTPIDVSTNQAGSGTSGNSGTTGATAVANELVVAALGIIDNTGASHADCGISDPATTGYTSLGVNNTTTDSTIAGQFSYKEVAATGTQVANWTWTDDSSYVGTIATFKMAPRIDTQPTDQLGGVGGTATFTVSATTSGGTLHYQWKDDGVSVGSDLSSYTTGALVTGDDGAIITVDVSDDTGAATSFNAHLLVRPTALLSWGQV